MSDEAVIGGSGKSGQALRDEMAFPERSDEEQAKRLLSGEAWQGFCRSLEAAGQHLLEFPTGETATPGELQAQAMKYVLGLTTGGILQALQLSDPDTPRIVRTPDSESKWG